MTNHNELVKEQLVHLLFGTVIFIVLGAIAVALDLAAAGVLKLGVSVFTHRAIEYAAHTMLVGFVTIRTVLGSIQCNLG